jgi:hypothetical protein
MRKRINFMILICVLISCKKNKGTIENISSHHANESHNMGENCMSCHKSGGSGKGEFQVAGTIYNQEMSAVNPNTTVYLRSEPNGGGEVLYTIEVDNKGNFFTTNTINFGSGLYPSVKGATNSKHMGQSITNGACNSCHHNLARIWTE